MWEDSKAFRENNAFRFSPLFTITFALACNESTERRIPPLHYSYGPTQQSANKHNIMTERTV